MTLNGHEAGHLNGAKAVSQEVRPDRDALLTAVEVRIDTYLGHTIVSLAALNRLKSGDVLALGASLAEPVELRVNGALVGRGELVAVGDNFGVRITEIA